MSTDAPVVVDTGILLAAADADDRWHAEASDVLQDRPPERLVLPVPVAVEAAWLIASRLGAATEAEFIASIAAGDFKLTDLTETDWSRCAELARRYLDLRLGLVDASVTAVLNVSGSPRWPALTGGTCWSYALPIATASR